MPKFTVSYETTGRPSLWELPPGATVEQVKSTPLTIETVEPFSTVKKTLMVQKSIYDTSVAYVKAGEGSGVWLDKAETQQVIDALKELLDA